MALVVASLVLGASVGFFWDDVVSGVLVADAQFLYTMAEKVTQTPFNTALPPFLSGCVGILGIYYGSLYAGLNVDFVLIGAMVCMDGYVASIKSIAKALTLPEVTYASTEINAGYSDLVAWYLKQQAKAKS